MLEIIISTIIVLIAAIIGAVVSRMCGGGKPQLKYGLDQFIYGLPYLLLTPGSIFRLVGAGLRVIAYAGAVIAKRLGHGQWMATFAGAPRQPEWQDERLDFIVKIFFGEDRHDLPPMKRFYRNLFGMTLSGIVVGLFSAAILAYFGHFLAAAIILLGAAIKGPCYAVSWKLGYGTEGGEYATGFFGWGSCAAAYLVLLG